MCYSWKSHPTNAVSNHQGCIKLSGPRGSQQYVNHQIWLKFYMDYRATLTTQVMRLQYSAGVDLAYRVAIVIIINDRTLLTITYTLIYTG